MTSNNQHAPFIDPIGLALANDTCPNCGKQILPMQAIGTGDLADGRFCSFSCLVQFKPYASLDDGALEMMVDSTNTQHE